MIQVYAKQIFFIVQRHLNFNPQLCRNESEVESKLIVQYLLPKLGYSPESWHQEVAFGRIRLDFLAFATQVIPFKLDANSPLGIVIEAKHPKENLDHHARRLRRYLTSLNVKYGLLTNAKEIRIYERQGNELELVFQCRGQELNTKIDEIKNIIGKDNVAKQSIQRSTDQTIKTGLNQKLDKLTPNNPVPRQKKMKILAVYHNKGGVGKTTTVVNLAAAIRKKGKKVLVIDLDSQANTTFATGLIRFSDEEFDDIRENHIYHVLSSEDFYTVPEVARKSNFSDPDIDVVPSHISLMQYENELNQNDYSKLMLIKKLKSVEDQYDVVILDTPPSLNLYARVALITADYLIIPSDLKPFANQGLVNVKDFIKKTNEFKKFINKPPLTVLGVLPSKISTHTRFVQHTLPKRIEVIPQRYEFEVMDTVIYEREDLAKSSEQMLTVGELEIPDPKSVLDFKPDSRSAQEFEVLAMEVLQKIGITV